MSSNDKNVQRMVDKGGKDPAFLAAGGEVACMATGQANRQLA
jgi:hypothetical protein